MIQILSFMCKIWFSNLKKLKQSLVIFVVQNLWKAFGYLKIGKDKGETKWASPKMLSCYFNLKMSSCHIKIELHNWDWNYVCFLTGGYTARDSENPFSFRHFLRRPQNTTPNIQSEHRDLDEEFEASRFGGARPKTRGRNPRQRSDCDVKSPCGLPDFVQDHLILDHESESLHSSGYHNHVNDFRNQTSVENPLDLPRSHSPIHAAGNMIDSFKPHHKCCILLHYIYLLFLFVLG